MDEQLLTKFNKRWDREQIQHKIEIIEYFDDIFKKNPEFWAGGIEYCKNKRVELSRRLI